MKIERSLNYIITDMSQMETYLSRRDVKYRRNYNRYYNNGNRIEDIHTVYGNILSFYTTVDESNCNIPQLNVLRSAIDTTVSKLSQLKVRPFFNPILGNYKTVKTCRNAQIYFDEIYEMENIYKKAVNAITDSLIFDMGVLWMDDETKSVSKVNPWDFIFDAGEMSINKLTRVELRRKYYPLIDLRDIIDKDSKYASALNDSPNGTVDYRIYWDLIGKKQYKFIGNDLIATRDITYEVPPFVWIYYKDPIKGAFSNSMLDIIYQIQKQIDSLTYKISVASQLSPANLVFVPRGSDVKSSMVAASKIGDVFEYNQTPSGGVPISVTTPAIIDPMYIQLLEMFEQKAYNMVGVSQLSAQSKKPSGLNSGVALDTLEDVESERHNVIQMNYARFCRDIAERIIDIYPNNEEVLPKRRARSSITWKDIKAERELFNIQYSSASSLSKDPKIKMEQIEKLIAMKVIDPSLAATLLEFPDLESAYSINTASYDMNEKTIERVIENGPDDTGKFTFYECTNIAGLLSQTVNTLMRLDTNDEKPAVLNNLVLFIQQLKVMMDEIYAAANPPPPMPALSEQIKPPMTDGVTNNLPLEGQVM